MPSRPPGSSSEAASSHKGATLRPRKIPPRAKGTACDVCHERRVRCTGEAPTCAACVKLAKFYGVEPTACTYPKHYAKPLRSRYVHHVKECGDDADELFGYPVLELKPSSSYTPSPPPPPPTFPVLEAQAYPTTKDVSHIRPTYFPTLPQIVDIFADYPGPVVDVASVYPSPPYLGPNISCEGLSPPSLAPFATATAAAAAASPAATATTAALAPGRAHVYGDHQNEKQRDRTQPLVPQSRFLVNPNLPLEVLLTPGTEWRL